MKIAHSFSHFVSNQFHVIILSLPIEFYMWLSKNFSKPTSKNGEIGCFSEGKRVILADLEMSLIHSI